MALFKKSVSVEYYLGNFFKETNTAELIRSTKPSEVSIGYLGLDMLVSVLYKKHSATQQYFKVIRSLMDMPDKKKENLMEVSQVMYETFKRHYSNAPGIESAVNSHLKDIDKWSNMFNVESKEDKQFAVNHIYAAASSHSTILQGYSKIALQNDSKQLSDNYLMNVMGVCKKMNSNLKIKR